MVEIVQGIWQPLWEQGASDAKKHAVQTANRRERLRVWKKLRTIRDRMSVADTLDILTHGDEEVAKARVIICDVLLDSCQAADAAENWLRKKIA